MKGYSNRLIKKRPPHSTTVQTLGGKSKLGAWHVYARCTSQPFIGKVGNTIAVGGRL